MTLSKEKRKKEKIGKNGKRTGEGSLSEWWVVPALGAKRGRCALGVRRLVAAFERCNLLSAKGKRRQVAALQSGFRTQSRKNRIVGSGHRFLPFPFSQGFSFSLPLIALHSAEHVPKLLLTALGERL